MEMESTRRSIDRSREPGAKKPRLIDDTSLDRALNGVIDRDRERERSFPSSRAGSGLANTGQASSRFKVTERERDVERNDSVRGGVQLQQQKSQQQNQELLSQYKLALAELTFNSKPIITNLTIIAGENVPVAKWIAATVCANIIEVPSDQKLPSLYLLDSIVKNIGGDYIKYFAARLPEVFCKAYRQVDSSIHPGMRHLFGTWKEVFPPACLQMIEKELGFSSANGSSSRTVASRPESQSQRPPHSIHVNPKYLEARQRSLQQSNRVKGVNANSGTTVPSDDDDAERPDRNTTIGGERPWTDLPIKEFKHRKRESSSESLHEKNGAGYEDNEYSSDLSRNSDLGYVRAGERGAEQNGRDKSWYAGDRNATEATASQRDTFDTQREFSKYRASRSGVAAAQVQQKDPRQSIAHSGSKVMNKNWKNSEEEEYTWDDMSSRFPRKERWTGDDAEKMEIEDNLPQPRGDDIGSRIHGDAFTDSLSLAHRGQTTFGHQISSTWPSREPHLGDGSKLVGMTSRISGQPEGNSSLLGGLSTSIGSSLGRIGLQTLTGLSAVSTPSIESLVNTTSSGGILGQKRHQPQQTASPSGQSSMLLHPSSSSSASLRQHQESHNSTDDDRLQTRPVSLLGQNTAHHSLLPTRTYHTQPAKNPFPVVSQNHMQPGGLQNFQSIQSQLPQHMQNSSTSVQLSQHQHHSPFSLQSLSELTSQQSGQIQKPLTQSSIIGNPLKTGHSVLSHSNNSSADTSSVLATLVKSGILSNNSVSGAFPNMSFQEALPPHLNTRPPLPSGPPPTQLATSSAPTAAPASVLDPLTTHSLRTAAPPPLPPGPPPASSVSGTSSQTSGVANTVSNPYQFLLNSLVAKGLITPEKESSTRSAPQVPSQPHNQSPALITSSSLPVAASSSPSTILASSSGNELSFPESASKSTPTCSQGTTTEPKDFIGTEFKPDIIRQSHPSVISGLLFNGLPHQCNACGLRLKLQEQLDRHLEWHVSRNCEPSSSKVSRRWYANLSDQVHGNVKPPSGTTSTSSGKGLIVGVEKSEPVVPADETQCVCMLCGESFEDFYSHERDEWMFKGAVYMAIPAVSGEVGNADEGLIVHKNCISPSSVYDLGLMKNVKQGQNG